MPKVQLSKRLSWLLRHGALETGLAMDPAGWAFIEDVLAQLQISREALNSCVRENRKQRLQVDGDRIRATQGHSFAGTPVTWEALEASWSVVEGRTAPLVHGTRVEAVRVIASEGLRAMERTHVHLAPDRTSHVGKRARVEVLLHVDPVRLEAHGRRIFRSPNGVLLVRDVPWSCVSDLEAVTRSAALHEPELRGLLA